MTPTKAGAEFQVNTYTNSSQNEPVLTKLSNGGFVASWNSYGQDGSNYAVQAQMYDRWGNTVGSEFQVNTHTASDQSAPSITSLNDGGFVVVFHSNGSSADGNLYGVYGQRYDASGSTVGSEFLLNTFKSGYQLYPSVTSLSDGGFVAMSAGFSCVLTCPVLHSSAAAASLVWWKQTEFAFFFRVDSGLDVSCITDMLSP